MTSEQAGHSYVPVVGDKNPYITHNLQTDDFLTGIGVAYSSTGSGCDEAEHLAVGLAGFIFAGCWVLLGLAISNINATYFVGPRSIDLSDCACWLPFSLRCQVVLDASCEHSRVYANRSDDGSLRQSRYRFQALGHSCRNIAISVMVRRMHSRKQ